MNSRFVVMSQKLDSFPETYLKKHNSEIESFINSFFEPLFSSVKLLQSTHNNMNRKVEKLTKFDMSKLLQSVKPEFQSMVSSMLVGRD